MTPQRDLDDVLRAWVDEGDERLPQHNLQAALATIETTAQRGARWALLREFIMRLQPAAPILGVAAAAILAAALYLALGQNVGNPDPSRTPDGAPAPTFAQGTYETDAFVVPVSFSLPAAARPEGWEVTESSDMIRLSPDPGSGFELIMLPVNGTQLLVGGDAEAWPEDPVARLGQEAGVEITPMARPDVDEDLFLNVGGDPAPVLTLTFGERPAGAGGFLAGPDGSVVDRPDPGTIWWLVDASDSEPSMVIIYAAPREDHGVWFGSVAEVIETMQPR